MMDVPLRIQIEFPYVMILDPFKKSLTKAGGLNSMSSCIFAGYEILDLDRIPDTGPALLIYYHGAIPIDFYYIMAKCVLNKKRMIRAVGDRFLFNTPGKEKHIAKFTASMSDIVIAFLVFTWFA